MCLDVKCQRYRSINTAALKLQVYMYSTMLFYHMKDRSKQKSSQVPSSGVNIDPPAKSHRRDRLNSGTGSAARKQPSFLSLPLTHSLSYAHICAPVPSPHLPPTTSGAAEQDATARVYSFPADRLILLSHLGPARAVRSFNACCQCFQIAARESCMTKLLS